MWQPEPDWVEVSGSHGPATAGIWRVDREWIVKRVNVPGPDDPIAIKRLDSPSYWRREAEFALAELSLGGLSAPDVRRIDEDDEGYTLWTRGHARSLVTPDQIAEALAGFAVSEVEPAPWHAIGCLRAKVEQAEIHDGWPTLARTTVADIADAVWNRRGAFLNRLEAMPRVPAHGDLVQANVLTIRDGRVVVIDWGSFGWAAPGEDLGLYALSAGCDLEPLAWRYTDAVEGPSSYADVLWAGHLVTSFTVLSRAEWVLARVAPGEGALANKYRHPAVAPYLRALQKQLPAIEAVLES